MLIHLSDEDLRAICRTHIESFEKWARLLLHQTLTTKFGADYIHATNRDRNPKFRKEIVDKAEKMRAAEPGRFPTPLDTLYVDDILYFLKHDEIYDSLKDVMRVFYPEGKEELKTFISRLIPIRNKLSHTNPFSIRDAEKAICYSNDFIDAAKYYFEHTGMAKEFNVPNIIKISDSFGNEMIVGNSSRIQYYIKEPGTGVLRPLYKDDEFTLTLEMDPSFSPSDYDIIWNSKPGVEVLDEGRKIKVKIVDELIGEDVIIGCKIRSHKEWHRLGGMDQHLLLRFKALPPIGE